METRNENPNNFCTKRLKQYNTGQQSSCKFNKHRKGILCRDSLTYKVVKLNTSCEQSISSLEGTFVHSCLGKFFKGDVTGITIKQAD
ncbi:uncharacterized protein PHA67_009264 isoform 1-T1 [Liasis olivaceus]